MSVSDPPDPDDPVEYYKKYLRRSGKSEHTVDHFLDGINRFDEFRDEEALNKDYGKINEQDCIDFIYWLRQRGITDRTVGNYTQAVSGFYRYYNSRGTYSANPMSYALDETDVKNDSSSQRREISLAEMQEAIKNTQRPRALAIVMLFLKSAIRVGELSNIDLYDIHLQHPKAQNHLPEPRIEIRDRPGTLFIPSDIGRGDIVRGEKRVESNKRKKDTVIPIDDELEASLVYYIATRVPARSEAEPLFTLDTHPGKSDSQIGDRLNQNSIFQTVRRWAEKNDWYHSGGGVTSNVTPHYFRHYFSTHMRNRTNDEPFVKYIRGDVGDDILDRYTHNWGDKIKSTYLNNIYNFTHD